jgi:hypothetical protein
MYQAIVGVLGSVGLVMIWHYILKVPHYFWKVTGLNMDKPFSCGFCLSFWTCLIYLMFKTNWLDAIFISSVAPFVYLYAEDFITNKWEL